MMINWIIHNRYIPSFIKLFIAKFNPPESIERYEREYKNDWE